MNKRLNFPTRFALMALLVTLLFGSAPVLMQTVEAAPAGLGSKVVTTAYRYRGRPYVFGARGPRYFDCSGFTRYVYRLHGYYLPHSAAAQSRLGQYVSKSNLRAGDLVFFRNTYKRGISHVGIYVGSGRMIHAWPRRGVIVTKFTSYRYFTSRYAGARRAS
ncbi:MAG: C40 family peptidase [Bacillota bacterium]